MAFRVCENAKQIAELKQARRAGTKRQPSPEGLGDGWPRLRSAGGAALHPSACAAPPVLRRRWGIDVPALPGWADVWSRPYGPASVLRFVSRSHTRSFALPIWAHYTISKKSFSRWLDQCD